MVVALYLAGVVLTHHFGAARDTLIIGGVFLVLLWAWIASSLPDPRDARHWRKQQLATLAIGGAASGAVVYGLSQDVMWTVAAPAIFVAGYLGLAELHGRLLRPRR